MERGKEPVEQWTVAIDSPPDVPIAMESGKGEMEALRMQVEELQRKVALLARDAPGTRSEPTNDRTTVISRSAALEHSDLDEEEVAIEESVWDAALFLGLYTHWWETAVGCMLFIMNALVQVLFARCIVELGKDQEEFLEEDALLGMLLWRLTVGHHVSNFDEFTQSSLVGRVCTGYLGRTTSGLHADSYNAYTKYLDSDVTGWLTADVDLGEFLCLLCLLVWTTVIIAELIDIHKFCYGIMSLKRSQETMLLEHSSNGEYEFHCISFGRLAGLWVVVIIPRLIVSMILLYSGCLFLIQTTGINDLILNGVALAFVFELDDLFYMVLPSSCQRIVGHTQPLVAKPVPVLRKTLKKEEEEESKGWGFRGLREVLAFLCIWGVVFYFYTAHLAPQVQTMDEGRKLLCNGKQDFIYVSDRATGIMYYAETRGGDDLTDFKFLLFNQNRTFSADRREDWMTLDTSAALDQTALGTDLAAIQRVLPRTYAYQGANLSRLSTISDVTEKFRETALQAQGNLRCEDSDYDVPGQHAVFSAFLELVQIASLPTNLEREWDENLEEGVLNCSDVAALCDLARTRTLCPNVCECARVRSGRYDFSGCPAACDADRFAFVDIARDEIRTGGTSACTDAPLVATNYSTSLNNNPDWWRTTFEEVQAVMHDEGYLYSPNSSWHTWTEKATAAVKLKSLQIFTLTQGVNVSLIDWAESVAHAWLVVTTTTSTGPLSAQSSEAPTSGNSSSVVPVTPCGLIFYLGLFFDIQLCDTVAGRGTLAVLCPVQCRLCGDPTPFNEDALDFLAVHRTQKDVLGLAVLESVEPPIANLTCNQDYRIDTTGPNYGLFDGGDTFFRLQAEPGKWYTLDACSSADPYPARIRVHMGPWFATMLDSLPVLDTALEAFETCGAGAALTFQAPATSTVELIIVVESWDKVEFDLAFRCADSLDSLKMWEGTCATGQDSSGRECVRNPDFPQAYPESKTCSMRFFPSNIALRYPDYILYPSTFQVEVGDSLILQFDEFTDDTVEIRAANKVTYLGWVPDGTAISRPDGSDILKTWELCLRASTDMPWRLVSGDCTQLFVSGFDCITSPNYPELYDNNERCRFEIPQPWQNMYRIFVSVFNTESNYDYLYIDRNTANERRFAGDASDDTDLEIELNSTIPVENLEWESDGSVTYQGWFLCALPIHG